jgi:hypothetical protein
MGGLTGQSRYPKGFVLVDKPNGVAVVYDYKDGDFIAREPVVLDDGKRWSAAESDGWDVRAYDDGELPENLEVGL